MNRHSSWARWVRDEWQTVRVTHVKTVPLRADVPGRVRVRVNVHLGALAPADVLVEARTDQQASTDASAEWPIRLFSAQSYGNGTYVFEGLLAPHTGVGLRPLTIRVRPGALHEALSALRDVVHVFDLRVDSVRAATRAQRSRSEPLAPVG